MMKRFLTVVVLMFAASVAANALNLDFTTFVTTSSIATAEPGGQGTIGFNFDATKFVGSEYYDNQLYQTSLTGGSVTTFGAPIGTGTSAGLQTSGLMGEVVVGASLGQGGFTLGNVFVGSAENADIFEYNAAGTTQTLFATLPGGVGTVRQIFFDPGTTFGGDMIVTTTSGHIYTVTSAGVVTLLANVGEDSEGMDIIPTNATGWGPYAGDLLVGSEDSGTLRLISPGGTVTVLGAVGDFPEAETVSFVPLTLNTSDPLEGFYDSNYGANNIQFASASNFTGILGDVIVTCEDDCPGNNGSTVYNIQYIGGAGCATTVSNSCITVTQFTMTGTTLTQSEDGEFVTLQREADAGTPEPATLLLLGPALLGLVVWHKRRRKTAVC